MKHPRLSKLEVQIMEALWAQPFLSVREIQETFPAKTRPAFTTVQTMVYRLEGKGALRRVKKIGNAFVFEALISRNSVQRRIVDEFLGFFGGRMQPVMHHFVETGMLTIEDVQAAERRLRELAKKGKEK